MTKSQGLMGNTMDGTAFIHSFQSPPTNTPLPSQFDYPHQFTPNAWAVEAAKQLQERLTNESLFNHDFHVTLGKMFGVLVVESTLGEIGFLTAFSGKIAERTKYEGFVPPIFDTLNPKGIFKIGEAQLNTLNAEIIAMESNPHEKEIHTQLDLLRSEQLLSLENMQRLIVENKKLRDAKRQENPTNASVLSEINQESKREQMELKAVKKEFQKALEPLLAEIATFEKTIEMRKQYRAQKSLALQIEIFQAYEIRNGLGETKNILNVFKETKSELPPGGTGECALPKMLNFAFQHQMRPVCFAEFWWGKSPVGEVRMHQSFYPSCRGKCEPLLKFMLQRVPTFPHPLQQDFRKIESIKIHFDDDHLLVIDKPHGMLSVPGKMTLDSVQDWLKRTYPSHPEILPVHRLDMATSGLLVIAKSLSVYKILQAQFSGRKVSKVYTAILAGHLQNDLGTLNLPLRVNLNHRPHQMVCYEHGKSAVTHYKVVERVKNQTRVVFQPITGRTHQLRVHAAHADGLNTPILGDDLYGKPGTRLHLHASQLSFTHPVSLETLTFNSKPDF